MDIVYSFSKTKERDFPTRVSPSRKILLPSHGLLTKFMVVGMNFLPVEQGLTFNQKAIDCPHNSHAISAPVGTSFYSSLILLYSLTVVSSSSTLFHHHYPYLSSLPEQLFQFSFFKKKKSSSPRDIH